MIHISRNEDGGFVVTTSKAKSKTKDKLKARSVKPKSKDSSTTSTTSSSKTTGTSKADSEESNPVHSKSKTKLKEVVEPGTSRAKEVDEYLNKEVYFTRSKSPRSSKPRHVKLSVGQVVKHVGESFYGVIVGWDEVAKVSHVTYHMIPHVSVT